jgi:hypothetical protein
MAENEQNESWWSRHGISLAALILYIIWFYIELQNWKKHGDDYTMLVVNIVVTTALWILLLVAIGRYWRHSKRVIASAESWDDPNLIPMADASRDFSSHANPSGMWVYGYYRGGLRGEFFRHETPGAFRDVGVWSSEAIDRSLSVMHHPTRRWIEGSAPTYAIPPDTINMHPGERGTYVVVRWTCPQEGHYKIRCEFQGLDAQTTHADSDVDVRHNSRSLCDDGKAPEQHNLKGIGSKIAFKFDDLYLRVDDKMDFVVGVGPSGFYGSDSTGLKAKIYRLKTGI